MDGVDLSPLLRGRRPREWRKFAYGGYANWHYARTQEWAYVANNFGVGRRLYDLERDPKEENNIARRHRKRLDGLDAAIRRRAGEAIAGLSLTPAARTRQNRTPCRGRAVSYW